MGWFIRTFYTLAAAGAVYVATVCVLTIPTVQRKATYAHNLNPAAITLPRFMRQNLSNVEQFGFVHHQVQPFTFRSTTVSNEEGKGEVEGHQQQTLLYAWHILPAHLYRRHETALKAQRDFGVKELSSRGNGDRGDRDSDSGKDGGNSSNVMAQDTVGLRLLFDDPNARVVICFHGNAGHLGSSYRPATYRQILATSTVDRPVHVVAFDYRGFGLSTGTPTEDGVVQDGVALLSYLAGMPLSAVPPTEQDKMEDLQRLDDINNNYLGDNNNSSSSNPAATNDSTTYLNSDNDCQQLQRRLHPSQIILAGQSMGTFISTAVYHHWTLRLHRPAPKGLLLFASFSSLPKLLHSYSIKGITPPLLSPLAGYPWIQRWFMSRIVDHWDTASRLKELISSSSSSSLDLTIMHARDDWEIPWREGKRNWEAVLEAAGSISDSSTGTLTMDTNPADPNVEVALWTDEKGLKRVKWEKIRHGGHNRIPVGEHAKLALIELLER